MHVVGFDERCVSLNNQHPLELGQLVEDTLLLLRNCHCKQGIGRPIRLHWRQGWELPLKKIGITVYRWIQKRSLKARVSQN